MPPVDTVLPSTLTECLRIGHALMHGPRIAPGRAWIVMSRIAPMHHVYGVAGSEAEGQRLYVDAGSDTGGAWTADDASQRALFGPIEVPGPPSRSGSSRAASSGTGSSGRSSTARGGGTGYSVLSLSSDEAAGHTCWSDPYSLDLLSGTQVSSLLLTQPTVATADQMQSLACAQILGGYVRLDVMTTDEHGHEGEHVSGYYRLAAHTDACFFTAGAIENFIVRPYRAFYGDAFVAATWRPRRA